MRHTNNCHDFGHAKILIVEDNNLIRAIIKDLLESNGFSHIIEAENGAEGLERAQEYKPDIIIMDIQMPVMDGIECCKKIRADKNISDTVILVQTALQESQDKVQIFRAGVDDYISKPIDPNELIARVSTHLEHYFMAQNLRNFNERVKHELKIARETQEILLPKNELITQTQKNYPLSIHQHFQPSSEMGGDFWGFRSLSSHKLAIYLADFSGHGINAALNTFRLHALMQNNLSLAHQPGAYLTQLNVVLTPLLPVEQFATMFYGVIDIEKQTLSYATAAAPSPILFEKNAKSAILLEGRGLPLGVTKDIPYESYETPFRPSDMVLMYSDALIETPDKDGDYFEENAIINFMQQSGLEKGDANTGFQTLLSHFKTHFGKNLADDLTLNGYYYTG